MKDSAGDNCGADMLRDIIKIESNTQSSPVKASTCSPLYRYSCSRMPVCQSDGNELLPR